MAHGSLSIRSERRSRSTSRPRQLLDSLPPRLHSRVPQWLFCLWLRCQFFARIVLQGVKDRVSVMRQSCASATLPTGLCFERLSLNDGKDQYLDRGGVASFDSFRRFRSLILDTLQLEPPPFPAASALSSTPLRVTIYSRHDSSRRRIMNVAELTAALSPHHIVRHVPNFGQRPPHEQLALYANTDLLIAPHGAHMTFAFLLPANAIVLEAFAHEEGKFSWTVNFLKGSANYRRQQQQPWPSAAAPAAQRTRQAANSTETSSAYRVLISLPFSLLCACAVLCWSLRCAVLQPPNIPCKLMTIRRSETAGV